MEDSDFKLYKEFIGIYDLKYNIKTKDDSNIELTINSEVFKKYRNHYVLIWNTKNGALERFDNPFTKYNKLTINKERYRIESDKQTILSVICDDKILLEIDLSKISDKDNHEIVNLKEYFKFELTDNIDRNKDIGRINSKIEIGESFRLIFNLNNPKGNQYKIWFGASQRGIKPIQDTFLLKTTTILDSVQFVTPFEYPKYGKKIQLIFYYNNLNTNKLDSSILNLEYDKLIPYEFTQRYMFSINDVSIKDSISIPNISRSGVFPVTIISNSDLSVVFKENGLIYVNKRFNHLRYKSDIKLVLDFGIDSLIMSNLIGQKDSLLIPSHLRILPFNYKLIYSKEDKYKTTLNIGVLLNPLEFSLSSQSGLPIGVNIGFKKKNGINIYLLSNFNKLEPDLTLLNESQEFPVSDFNHFNYNQINRFQYELLEVGLTHQLLLNNSFDVIYGLRYSDFNYAVLVKKTYLITNYEDILVVKLLDKSFRSIDPILGINYNINNKTALSLTGGSRNLSFSYLTCHLGFHIKI